MSRRFFGLLCCVLALAGCVVGPEFKPPVTPQVQWHSAFPHGGKLESLDKWWQQLNDPLLSQLIIDTEKNNPSVDMALAKMNEREK